jgi:uncharacterized radical SAM superfamily Fe-S cluster-containing enzyme
MEVRGVGTYENTLDYWLTIAAKLREHHVPGLLLIDETTGEPLPAEKWKALVRAMTGKGLEHVRIAHVKPHGLQRIEYCELSAREAGLEARVFTDEAEADLWLRYGEHTRST